MCECSNVNDIKMLGCEGIKICRCMQRTQTHALHAMCVVQNTYKGMHGSIGTMCCLHGKGSKQIYPAHV